MDDTIAVTVAGSLMNAEAEMEAAGFSSKNSLLHRIMLVFQIRSRSVGYRACRTLSPQAAQQGNIRHATPRVKCNSSQLSATIKLDNCILLYWHQTFRSRATDCFVCSIYLGF